VSYILSQKILSCNDQSRKHFGYRNSEKLKAFLRFVIILLQKLLFFQYFFKKTLYF